MIQNTTVHRFDYIQILNSRTLKNSKKKSKNGKPTRENIYSKSV